MPQGNIPGLARLDGKGDPHQIGLHGIEAGGLGVEADAGSFFQPLHQLIERLFSHHSLVVIIA